MPTVPGTTPSGRGGRASRSRPGLKSVSRRLTAGFLLIAAIGVLGADVYCVLTLSGRLREQGDRQIVQLHRRRMEALSEGRTPPAARDGSSWVVVGGRGEVRLRDGAPSVTSRLPLSSGVLRERAGVGRPTAFAGGAVRAVVSRLPDGGYLVTARSTASEREAVRTLVGVETAVGVPLIALLVLGALWCSRRTLVPLREMLRSARQIAEGSDEPSDRVPVATRSLRELRCTADTLNYLLRRIEEGAVRRRSAELRLHELVGAASHELRTPLTTITGYTQLARLGALDDPHRMDHAMEQVEREIQRINQLVEDLLLLAHLSHGGTLERRPVDLARLCAEAVRRAQASGPRHTHALRCVTESPVHLVEGDPGRLEQVVGHLLSNVLIHTPENTSAELRLRLEGDRQVIDVVDQGPGVPETARDHIFEPFFRAEHAPPAGPDSDPGRGRGLGLSVAAVVVKAHGGSIGLQPSERGAWFHVTLPAFGTRSAADIGRNRAAVS